MATIPLQRGATYDVDILDKIAAKGRGIARYKDFVIFVKGAVPGQKVQVQINKIKNNYAEAKIVHLIKRSPLEIKPKCPHFGKCGGCVWQNLTYDKQLYLKEKQVRETIQHLGKVKKFEVYPILPSPKLWAYRNKIEMSFGFQKMWVETKDDKRIYHDEGPCLGFHASESWEQIVKIDRCYIFNPKIQQICELFNRLVAEEKFTVYNPKTHKGLLRQLVVRSTDNIGNLLVNLVINTIPPKEQKSDRSRRQVDKKIKYATQFGGVINELSKIVGMQGILITESSSLNDSLTNLKPRLMWGKDCIYEKLGKLKFKISPFSFFQTNTTATEELYRKVAEFANLQGTERILDLYCGTGAIGLYLANKCRYVYGMDVNSFAIEDARGNAKLNDLNNVEFICGAVESELRTLNAIIKDCQIDQIIVDPPRAGMHKNVVRALAAGGIKKIIYVSCNPATLARDIEKFSFHGYYLTKAQPVDMFPHTAHTETVVELLKK